jgi:hypothetical protein
MFWIHVKHLLDQGNEVSTLACGHEKNLIHHVQKKLFVYYCICLSNLFVNHMHLFFMQIPFPHYNKQGWVQNALKTF